MEAQRDRVQASFITALGFRLLPPDGDLSRATALLGPATWAKDAPRPRLGALVTMVDLVAGLRPGGALIPTVDLNVQVVRPLPARGTIDLECRPLKEGRRLFVGEVFARHEGTLLARAVATFVNQRYAGSERRPPRVPEADLPTTPFDDWMRPRYADERTVLVEWAPEISNGVTLQGGAQATVAELAAEWVLAPVGPFVATELDIRYLNPVTAGPVAATAEVLAVHDDRAYVSVRLTDRGDGDRLISYVTTVCRPAE
jgi:acyl-coenzyme A thioesterase PaaI-like protein